MSEPIPQLHMLRALDHLPDLVVPNGYELRTLSPDDVHTWATVMNENGEFGAWPIERAAPLFGSDTPVVFAGSFFVTRNGVPVGTAQLQHQTKRPYAPLAELGWVGVSPGHRGHGLGSVVCLAVLRYAASIGHTSIFLRTEDHRLPAIHMYLMLGFEPWMYEPTAPRRWQSIRQRIADNAQRKG